MRQDGPLVSPFTVNDLTEQLKKLFTRAKLWGVRFDRELQWRKHWLAEPQVRVRELHEDEAERIERRSKPTKVRTRLTFSMGAKELPSPAYPHTETHTFPGQSAQPSLSREPDVDADHL